MKNSVLDLRSAIALLQQHENQYLETNHPVDPNAELAGVYRHIGAGGTVKRPTRTGPAMMFNSIKGYPGSRILVGMHASRERAALLLGCKPSELALHVGKAVKNPISPVVVPASQAPCQEVVFRADDPDFDLRKLLPAPTNTPIDAGPFFCLGLVLASDPEDASLTDVTIHRLCVQERDELSMFLAAGRHIEVFRQKAEKAGKPLPVTINMGLEGAAMWS
jgi:4-hydroxy-3-polyprenylbenzoate decarboxylase